MVKGTLVRRPKKGCPAQWVLHSVAPRVASSLQRDIASTSGYPACGMCALEVAPDGMAGFRSNVCAFVLKEG